MTARVFEGKYEIDSLCAFLKLSYWHWRYSGDEALLRYADSVWITAVSRLLDTVEVMQLDDGRSSDPPYLFQRLTSEPLDSLIVRGRGPASRPNGLSRSLFRPSDDAVTLPYNIPGNAMACVELNHVQELILVLISMVKIDVEQLNRLLARSQQISYSICSALSDILNEASRSGSPIPFEVDGFGSKHFMDDANIPSLLSLPVLGYLSGASKNYRDTRDSVLSARNPFYFEGSVARGVGGPHVGYNYTWPMSIITQAMTSDSDEEIRTCLSMLVASSAGTGLMHESFNVNDADDYTRDWFAWVNGLLGDLILFLVDTRPHLVLLEGDQYDAALRQARRLVVPPVSSLAQQETIAM